MDDEDDEYESFKKLDPSPILTNLFERIKGQMSYENLRKKRCVVDECPEIGKLKINEGSILEYMPSYNNLFNKGKFKVFPLQSLEEIVSDSSKYNHTKRVVL